MKAKLGTPTAEVVGRGRVLVTSTVQNAGERSWTAGGPIRLGYLILDPASGALIEDGGRAELPKTLDPQELATLDMLVELPPEDGRYCVLVSALEENVAWFHEHGSDSLLLDIEVADGTTRILRLARTTGQSRAWERVRSAAGNAVVYPFRTLWSHHSLIASMVRRDINGRYRGSVAGLFWTVINPLLLMLTYFMVFGLILHVRFGPDPSQQNASNFVVYFLAGMLPWLAINEALGRSAGVVIEHRLLVKRIVFPIEILPVNVVAAGLVSEFFGMIVFLGALLVIRQGVPWTALYLPLILIPQVLFTMGLAWLFAGLGVFLRDVGQFLGFFLTLVFFATPICYAEPKVGGTMKLLYSLNPVYVLVRSYRAVFLEGTDPAWLALAWLSTAGLLVFFLGFAWFYKSRRAFPDVL